MKENAMPQLNVSDETYRRLSEKAAVLNVSVDDLVRTALDRLAGTAPPAPEPIPPLTGAAWWAVLEEWKRAAAARAGRYPPGFRVDDSRESMYREREDAQL